MSNVRAGAESGGAALALGALGVVFGDIGTSPLYALQTVFSIDDGVVAPTHDDVHSVISLVFWSVTVVVSVKYVAFVLRADNDGEGGIMALAALARRMVRPGGRRAVLVMLLGVLGASLFYGDSVITPAISVMSAIEGLSVPEPSLRQFEVPLGAAVITGLFLVQRAGTARVGRLFGPVMVVWFVVLALLGLRGIAADPEILTALSPHWGVLFIVEHPGIAFVAMGAVVLSITGAEALYADMGHFGRDPIRRAWFFLVFPCLTLNYLGQGGLVVSDPSKVSNPFYLLAPSWAVFPLVVLATAATVIASQAVISGAFSVSRQAERLGYLPRLTVRHTSQVESGQIYVPAINWILYAAVLLLLLTFQSSEKLATAYGLAVTGTFLLTTTLFLVLAEAAWGWSRRRLVVVGLLFGGLELVFFAANLTKIVHGGWLPVLIAVSVATIMLTWQRGGTIVTAERRHKEGPIQGFVRWVRLEHPTRVPGTAVFVHPSDQTTPLALRENTRLNHVLHEHVVIVSTISENVPHMPDDDSITWHELGEAGENIIHIALHYGFQDDQNVPLALTRARDSGVPVDPDGATYFLSRITLQRGPDRSMPAWRKRLFIGLAHNAASPIDYFRLPNDRTVSMGSAVQL
ncbi:potassium transporter Kup [Humibacillus sp. DSM 29435]|uniref:potassium transporter Kup n=1 Tax=Humibacillus sp. DSM 29435 TaxID=1869167 RepID=UPI00087320EB|nr:KUP/HAK/KT family potassium transporter [Humibacillus sp. DSM 29435]OFE16743.1 potassium transporter Kup [Humibacillus sp. DSM 29435]